jgi:hypothetical protein
MGPRLSDEIPDENAEVVSKLTIVDLHDDRSREGRVRQGDAEPMPATLHLKMSRPTLLQSQRNLAARGQDWVVRGHGGTSLFRSQSIGDQA